MGVYWNANAGYSYPVTLLHIHFQLEQSMPGLYWIPKYDGFETTPYSVRCALEQLLETQAVGEFKKKKAIDILKTTPHKRIS